MSPVAVLGLLLGLVTPVAALVLTAEDPSVFINLPGLLIVVGGTLAATLVSHPLDEVLRIVRASVRAVRGDQYNLDQDVDEIVAVARRWYAQDLQGAERRMAAIRNPFLQTGIQAVVDGAPMDEIADLLHWRMARLQAREMADARLFRSMATFAPAFGMLGTLIGLINLLLAGESEPDFAFITVNLGVALMTTLYGILLANLLFRPMAIRLERQSEGRIERLNLVLEGILRIRKGESPAHLRESLYSRMALPEDGSTLAGAKAGARTGARAVSRGAGSRG